MRVTQVNVKKLDNTENKKLKGYATIILDDELAIHNIAILEGTDKLFISMPSQKYNDKYYDYVHPIVSSLRQDIEQAIITDFNR